MIERAVINSEPLVYARSPTLAWEHGRGSSRFPKAKASWSLPNRVPNVDVGNQRNFARSHAPAWECLPRRSCAMFPAAAGVIDRWSGQEGFPRWSGGTRE